MVVGSGGLDGEDIVALGKRGGVEGVVGLLVGGAVFQGADIAIVEHLAASHIVKGDTRDLLGRAVEVDVVAAGVGIDCNVPVIFCRQDAAVVVRGDISVLPVIAGPVGVADCADIEMVCVARGESGGAIAVGGQSDGVVLLVCACEVV